MAGPHNKSLSLARPIAFGVPLALLAGAWSFQLWGGLTACEMCWWQRYALIAALVLGGLALVIGSHHGQLALVALAGMAIAGSAAVGGYHAGVEYHWWQGFTACSSTAKFGHGDPLAAIMAAPIVRCDEVQWQFAGISLAGFNFLISGLAAVVILVLVAKGMQASGARKRS